MVYCARVDPIPGQDVPLLLPPFAEEYVAECESMHWPSVYLGTAPALIAAAVPAGIVLSTLASSADANKASPAGELPEPSDAKSTPPSSSPARWPDPAKAERDAVAAVGRLNEVLRHEVERRFGVRRGEEGRDRSIGPRPSRAPAPTAAGRTASTIHDAPTSPGNESFLDNRVPPFGVWP